ncbi:MAG: hypothetical protein AB7O95_20970 [Geminicoccaceae bacterium]
MSLPWFRMYAEFATDPVAQCLSFDDQRHFVMLLCFKCGGLLDRPFASRQQRMDVIRKSLGLDGKAWEEMRHRLIEIKLIDEEMQPTNWNKRQFLSDNSTERVRRYRQRRCNVSVTPSDTESDTDSEKRERGLSLSEIQIPECPKDMDAVIEHGACAQYYDERRQAVTPSVWRSWVLRAVKSGVYARRGSRPPTEEEIQSTRRACIARMAAEG